MIRILHYKTPYLRHAKFLLIQWCICFDLQARTASHSIRKETIVWWTKKYTQGASALRATCLVGLPSLNSIISSCISRIGCLNYPTTDYDDVTTSVMNYLQQSIVCSLMFRDRMKKALDCSACSEIIYQQAWKSKSKRAMYYENIQNWMSQLPAIIYCIT